ncbi:hypothetical protein F4815DRAFT_499229 [Daldinia loculata]|nr:hypothetical protein F4815DRAFT_499229 [Daldinia loculata]
MSSGSQNVEDSAPQVLGEALSQLDEALASIVEEKGVRVVAITTHIGAGKSTVIVDHIWRQAKAGKAPPSIIYVVSTLVESILLRDYLSESGTFTEDQLEHSLEDTYLPVMIRSALQFLKQFEKLSLKKNCTVVVDVNWYPSVEDEIAFGRLISWLSAAKEGEGDSSLCCVLLMSAFESQRTVAAFERRIGKVLRLDRTGFEHPKVDIEIQQGEGWKDQVGQILLDTLYQDKKVVVATDSIWDFEYLEDEPLANLIGEVYFVEHENVETVGKHLKLLKQAPILVIGVETPFSTKIEGLGMFVSTGSALRTNRLVPGLMQIVRMDRGLSWLEVLRQHSWVSKSAGVGSSGPSGARFLCPAGEEELKARGEHTEDLGRAWNVDFMFTALAHFHTWPGRQLSRMPTRRPPNDYVFADAVRRLLILGCIKQSEEYGTYECTPLGATIMERRQQEFKDKFEFHVAYLLARTRLKEGERPEVLRVLIRLAAIAHNGVKFLFHRAQDTDTSKLRELLPPLIRGRAHAGTMWIALGLYLLCETVGFEAGEESLTEVGPFVVQVEQMRSISPVVKAIEGEFGLPIIPADSSWMDQPLKEAELQSIDKDMMWAWLHRIGASEPAESPSGVETITDWVSLEDFGVKMNKEIIQQRDIRTYCDVVTMGGRAFTAFYLQLKEKDGQRWARYLTWIPPEAIQDLKEKTGLSVTAAVGKTF